MSAPDVLTFETLYDPRGGADLAVADAVEAYAAIASARPSPRAVAAVRAHRPGPLDQITLLLRAALRGRLEEAATLAVGDLGPVQAVHASLAWRLFAEAYLGDSLFERLWGQPRAYLTGPPRIDGEAVIDPSPAPAPRLRAARTTPEVLYLLARDGLSGTFDTIDCYPDTTTPPAP